MNTSSKLILGLSMLTTLIIMGCSPKNTRYTQKIFKYNDLNWLKANCQHMGDITALASHDYTTKTTTTRSRYIKRKKTTERQEYGTWYSELRRLTRIMSGTGYYITSATSAAADAAVYRCNSHLYESPNVISARLYSMGHKQREAADYGEAIKYYKRAIRVNPDHDRALNNLGVTYAKLNYNREAIRYYKRAIKVNPDYVLALNNLAALYRRLNYNREAIKYYEELLTKEITNPENIREIIAQLKDLIINPPD